MRKILFVSCVFLAVLAFNIPLCEATTVRVGGNVYIRNLGRDNWDEVVRDDSETPLMKAAQRQSTAELLRRHVNAGEDVNAKNSHGETALMYSARYYNNPDDLVFLVSSGADVNARNNHGLTPLMYSVLKYSSFNMYSGVTWAGDYRIRRGCFIFHPLISEAGRNTNPEIVCTLIDLGADVNARDDRGYTALDYVARGETRPNRDVMVRLLDAGAEVSKETLEFVQKQDRIYNSALYEEMERRY